MEQKVSTWRLSLSSPLPVRIDGTRTFEEACGRALGKLIRGGPLLGRFCRIVACMQVRTPVVRRSGNRRILDSQVLYKPRPAD